MDNTLVVRQLLKDSISLSTYLRGNVPDVSDIRRRVLAQERAINHRLPDHIYRNRRDALIGEGVIGKDNDGLWPILKKVLGYYVDYYLLRRADRLFVRFERFDDWQHELARLSPLPIIAYALYRHFGAPSFDDRSITDVEHYAKQFLLPFEHTILLTPLCQPVEDLIGRGGLCETHLHLNGSTEVDRVWQDALGNIGEFANKLEETVHGTATTSKEELLAEFYQQLGLHRGKIEVIEQLSVARRLRLAMKIMVFDPTDLPKRPSGLPILPSLRDLMRVYGPNTLESESEISRHPISHRYGDRVIPGLMAQELLLLILTYQRLDTDRCRNGGLAHVLYAYLLSLNVTFVPLCVQQAEQFGFDQFQKITHDGVRGYSEKGYESRFHQLAGGRPGSDVGVLEGRFAPKPNSDDLTKLIKTIITGYYRYQGWQTPVDLDDPRDPGPSKSMTLRLIAHFIKEDQLPPWVDNATCRFHDLREKIDASWRAIRWVREHRPKIRQYLTGLDAASNELHTPPEVFAPVYRAARHEGMVHFTYHVGEDFEHLLSGIRAVYEAVTFLDLRDGNRIGHGTAVGIDPALWLARVPRRLYLRKGDRLDDMVFAYTMLLAEPKATHVLGRLQAQIQRLSRAIYHRDGDCNLLWAAWRLRRLDPRLFANAEDKNWSSQNRAMQKEVDEIRREEKKYPEAYKLFQKYHEPDAVRRSREFDIEEPYDNYDNADDIDPDSILDAELLYILQERVLEEIVKRRVVIETLPTSNVRISFYNNYSEHHVFRWLGLKRPGQTPQVCTGTDDPGIFACSLRGEYIHLYREILKLTGCERKTIHLIEQINNAGRIYRFSSPPGL